SRFPIVIYWGAEYVTVYNDAYSEILAKKHPGALGRRARDVWAEIWDVISPMLDSVRVTGQATWSDDLLLLLERHGYPEECYFSFSFSPVRGEHGQIGGVFTAVTETTQRVIGERRLRTLRDLAAGVGEAKSGEEACHVAVATMAGNPADLPFALLYLCDAEGTQAQMVGLTGLVPDTPASARLVDLTVSEPAPQQWPLGRVARTAQAELVADLAERFGPLPGGPWPESPHTALILPIASPTQGSLAGFLVAGVSPRRALDDAYRGFLELVAGHVATAIANARAYEAERRRAEALAEIDRAKTAFFSNVSHEFRTPLTLMLGPLEQALSDGDGAPTPPQRAELEVVHRNGLRLLKLVNTLLDFSRIEAGRIQAVYEPTNLAACTAELASVFRSAIERAGLRLVVECPALPTPVYVDREMWEKIVLNLLSNAFKFTFEGEIAVRLDWGGDHVSLTVRDTGTGIPAHELPHIFERFHRIHNARARTHEGTGIGLALVQELVRLHGGQITVVSTIEAGTTFTVTIPTGTAHLPADRLGAPRSLASTALGADSYVGEALRWLPDPASSTLTPPGRDTTLDDLGSRESAAVLPLPTAAAAGRR
ncbi:MAG: ATP-binding protein, partial [Acidobacteria bacterium]|nr:ATP-binding protein [Acidobacteriota bacterium]